MYLNGSLPSLGNGPSSAGELGAANNPLRSTAQQTNLIGGAQSMGSNHGSNPNLNKITIGIQKNSVALICRLCGNQQSTMKCAECLGMQFCYACDNMYHRHPKRKHHIRKSINLLNTTTNYFSNDDTSDMHHSSSQSINSLPNQQQRTSVKSDSVPIKHHIRGLEHSASVSSFGNAMFDPLSMAAMAGGQRSANMPPLPPPRRKKLNPNEPTGTARLPALNPYRTSTNELKAKLVMSSNPLSSSCSNLSQFNRQNQLNSALLMNNVLNKRQMYGAANGNVPISGGQSSIENWPRESAASRTAMMQNSYAASPQNIQNLQQLQHLINMQQNKQQLLANPYLQRRNLSLTDISSGNQLKLLNGAPFLPYAFDASSLSQSMDELLADEDDSYSDEDNCSNCSNSSHRKPHRHKKSSKQQVKRSSSRGSSMNESQSLLNQKLIRRSQSSAHLINPMLNPYDFDYVQQSQLLANLYYGQPLLNATISPASSIRSLEAVRRKNSVSSMLSNRTLVNGGGGGEFADLDDYKSKHSKYRRSRDRSASRQPSKSLCRSKSQTSNRSAKSYKSSSYADKSNRCMSSDSEVNDEECSGSSCKSMADDSTTTHSELDDKRHGAASYRKKSWTCRGCTFTNRLQMNICEMCSKTNPQLLKESTENGERTTKSRSGRADRQSDGKQSKEIKTRTTKTKHEPATGPTKSDHHAKRPSGYIEFTDELIKQQKEVEKELLRRIANEKLVEEENLRLEREQQRLNDKSRTAINSQNEEQPASELRAETDDLIKSNEIKTKTNSSSPVSSLSHSSANNSNNTQKGNLVNGPANRGAGGQTGVSKIRPPSFSLRQQINQFNGGGSFTNKTAPLTKNHSLDSSMSAASSGTGLSGRHREEPTASSTANRPLAEKKQFGVGKGSTVQQLAGQYNQRNTATKPGRTLEAAPQSVSLIDQPIRESDYDKKLLDGMQMFKLLKDAERKDFLAEELEIALSFSSNDPIGWLDENWSSMRETVLTLANNQLLGLCQEKNSCLITVNEEDARKALRFTKGNIWQAVDRCVNLKKPEIKETPMSSRIPVYAGDKQDVKSFTFNLKSLGQGSSNRDGNQAIHSSRPTDSILSNNQINQMESLLNDWYQKNLKSQSKTPLDSSAGQPNTSEKVKNLIAFLKQNGFFDTNKLSQDEIDEQMRILMNLLEQKLKETQESNQSRQSDRLVDTASSASSVSSNSSPVKEAARTPTDNSVGIEQEFEEIDEKMQQSLNFLEEIERKTSPKKEAKRTNFKNLRITSTVDDEDQDEPVHNINIKLENAPVEVSAKCNVKKGKIKIIKRKIYRNGSSEQQKSFEKVAYVNSMEEADLINLDEEINLNEVSQPTIEKETKKETTRAGATTGKTTSTTTGTTTSFNYVNDREYDERQISLNKSNNQLLIDDDVVKQLNQANPNFKYARTVYECGICCSKHHINELISMLFCEHRACKACLEKYFTIQIREKQRVLIKCPFCDQPEIQSDDENSVHDYLTLLQELVKNIVSKDLYELFQRKVRDRALHKDPNFKWCPNCSSGFLAANVEGNILRCPDCKSLSCSKCNELWKEEHRVLTCEQFKEWLLGGNDWMAEHKLSVHLNEFGITCPNPKCRFRYELSKGGCLHFKCAQCEHEFCYGCDASFRTGDRCSIGGKSCEKYGFHAHHPRNCLFYLRDKSAADLERLLSLNHIDYEIKDYDRELKKCEVMEQKEIEAGLRDEPCQREVEKFGNLQMPNYDLSTNDWLSPFARLHYIEHLAKLIKRNRIDPIVIFDEKELINVLKREQIEVPKKPEFTKNYRAKLIETVEKNSPLI